MKRGKPLQRKTPLKAKKPMSRGTSTMQGGTPLGSGKPAKPMTATLKRSQPSQPSKQKPPSRPARTQIKNRPPRTSPAERRTRKLVDERSDGFCEKCGTPGATDKAHRISRGVGGEWCPTNILDLCRDCHNYHHANPNLAYRGGWHLRSTSAPAESRVWFHHEGTFGWAHLHADGTFTWAEKDEKSA